MLAIGAHPDDIEIGCAGTLLKLIEQEAIAEVCWVVLSGKGERADEARVSAEALLDGVPRSEVLVRDFPDGFFPYEGQRHQGLLRGAEGATSHPTWSSPTSAPTCTRTTASAAS